MNKHTYKIVMGLCSIAIVAGLGVFGYGAKGIYDKHQAAIEAQIQKDKKLQADADRRKEAARLVKLATENTVYLVALDEHSQPIGTGTGFIIKSDNEGSWILTNKHVCMMPIKKIKTVEKLNNFNPVSMTLHNGKMFKTWVVRTGENIDLCLLRTLIKFKQPLKLSAKATLGEKLFSYGFPMGQSTMVYGKYKNLGAYYGVLYGETDARAWFGASGSPVMNLNGDVIGIIAAIEYNTAIKNPKPKDWMRTFFIPLEVVREFLEGVQR